jgi:hypothetical protein
MTNLEYKVSKTVWSFWSGKDKSYLEKILNDLDRNGWELTSVATLWETA